MNNKVKTIEKGKCPKCESENISFYECEPTCESHDYEAKCNDCGFEFKERYDVVFVHMTDKEGYELEKGGDLNGKED